MPYVTHRLQQQRERRQAGSDRFERRLGFLAHLERIGLLQPLDLDGWHPHGPRASVYQPGR